MFNGWHNSISKRVFGGVQNCKGGKVEVELISVFLFKWIRLLLDLFGHSILVLFSYWIYVGSMHWEDLTEYV